MGMRRPCVARIRTSYGSQGGLMPATRLWLRIVVWLSIMLSCVTHADDGGGARAPLQLPALGLTVKTPQGSAWNVGLMQGAGGQRIDVLTRTSPADPKITIMGQEKIGRAFRDLPHAAPK